MRRKFESDELWEQYVGQRQPGIVREVIAQGVVSGPGWAELRQVAISPKGDEIL